MKNPPRSRVAGVIAFLLVSALAAAAPAHSAAPAFAAIFGDHAVLQRGEPVTVWGTATPEQRVTISLGGNTAEASAGANGRWRVTMPALAAGGPHTLSVTGTGGATALTDIMIGDVYLCGGTMVASASIRLA